MIWRPFTRQSERLTFRCFKRADAKALPALLDDWQVAKWLSRTPFPYSHQDGRDWIRISRSVLRRRRGYSLAIIETDSKQLIGGLGLSTETGEFGYWLGRDHWGKGYATETVNMITQLGLVDSDMPKLWAMVMPGNGASKRVLEKVGYLSPGTRLHRFRGGEQSAHYYHLQQWEWQAAI